MTNHHLLEAWYLYAARADGFLGAALRAARAQAFQTQEQQRALLGILDTHYDALWLRLQAMPLPRPCSFTADLARIVAHVESVTATGDADLNLALLEELLRAGLQK